MDYSEFEFIVKLDDNNTLCKVKTYENALSILNIRFADFKKGKRVK